MSSPDLEKIKKIVTDALRLAPQRRAIFVETECAGDQSLLSEVRSLLEAAGAASAAGFMASNLYETTVAETESPPSRLSERPGSQIGPYKLLQPIGEGGYGSVFMAEQKQPVRRRVALKIIKLGMDTRSVIARFEAERQALAIMDHPNIARVFDAGATDSGRPYFVMELVAGDPITRYCDANHLSVAERVELFVQVCHAVQHAHQRGVIHRDIKPGNVLATTQDGRPFAKVIDFGIAKALADRLTEKTLFTEFRQFIGTPEYMSPEQAAGTLDIDTRTDIYSLGALLYELLTGSAPFDAKELRSAAYDEIRRIIREVEPPKPSTRLSVSLQTLPGLAANRRAEPNRLGGLMRGELDWIVMKALDKDRARRYESAGALAADLRRHISGEAVVAAPPTVTYRLRKLISRHKAALTLITSVFAALLAGVVVSTHEAVRANKARDVADSARVDADTARSAAENALIREAGQTRIVKKELAEGLLSQAESLRLAGDLSESRDRLMQSRSLFEELNLSVLPTDIALLTLAISNPLPLMEYRGHAGPVRAIAISRDGRTAVSGSEDSSIKLWDVATGIERRTFLGHQDVVTSIALSPDGLTILSGSCDKTLKLWDIETGRVIRTFAGHSGFVSGVAFSQDGHNVISGSQDHTIKIWDISSGKNLRTIALPSFPASTNNFVTVAFSHDGLKALSSVNNMMTLWDLSTGKVVRDFPQPCSALCIAFAPDGHTAVSGGADNCLRLWDMTTGRNLTSILANDVQLISADVSPDGHTAVSGGLDGKLGQWNLSTGILLRYVSGHQGGVECVAFSPDSQTALSGEEDNTLKLWDLRQGQEQREFPGHGSELSSLAFAPDLRTALSASFDRNVKLWDLATGRQLRSFSDAAAIGGRVSFSRDGNRVLSSNGPTVRVWDIASGEKLSEFSENAGSDYRAIVISPDGRSGISVDADKTTVRIWDIATGKEFRKFEGEYPVTGAVFSPNGRCILSFGRRLELWDVSSGQEIRLYPKDRVSARFVTFSPDGRSFLAGGQRLSLWDVNTGEKLQSFFEYTGSLYDGVISPDGQTVICLCGDGTMRLWDIATGKPLHSFYLAYFSWSEVAGACIAFSPDCSSVLSGGKDGSAVLRDFNRVKIYIELKRKLEVAQKALQSNPADAASLGVIGEWYAFRGRNDWAIEFLEAARAAGASISSLTLGRCYWLENRYDLAHREFLAAIDKHEVSDSYLKLCLHGVELAQVVPKITRVTATPLPVAGKNYYNWAFTIDGVNLGRHAPFDGDDQDIIITDQSNSVWNAGHPGDTVTINTAKWANSEIVIKGYTGAYDGTAFDAKPGDKIQISVTNRDNDVASNTYELSLQLPEATSRPAN